MYKLYMYARILANSNSVTEEQLLQVSTGMYFFKIIPTDYMRINYMFTLSSRMGW